jgi:multidrug efflux pump subunit AcrA (membrane-fusion protein)
MRTFIGRIAVAALALLTACSPKSSPASEGHGAHTDAPQPTNRVDIPSAVRDNLGITFAKVESRSVSRTIRIPGRFELIPDARREYRTMLEGKVEILVGQFEKVEPGRPLYRLDSPKWRLLQQDLTSAEASIRLASASVETIGPLRAAHKIHEQSLAETVKLLSERVAQLERLREAGGGKVEELSQARISYTNTQAELADVMEKDADLEARSRTGAAELDSARVRFDLLLRGAASLIGATVENLSSPARAEAGAPPRWRTLETVEVRASAAGIVEALAVTNGAWVEQSSLVLSTVQPERIRMRAHALQSDLIEFKDGETAVIVPPRERGVDPKVVMRGPLVIGTAANPRERTFEVFVMPERLAPWAKPGVAASLEVAVAGGTEELAIPLSAIARDGLKSVIFRRDPKDPDKVIRLEADLGVDDGRWIVVKSAVMEGDEVVLNGVYQLMLATSGTAAKGGHFHADGTFHAGEDK